MKKFGLLFGWRTESNPTWTSTRDWLDATASLPVTRGTSYNNHHNEVFEIIAQNPQREPKRPLFWIELGSTQRLECSSFLGSMFLIPEKKKGHNQKGTAARTGAELGLQPQLDPWVWGCPCNQGLGSSPSPFKGAPFKDPQLKKQPYT